MKQIILILAGLWLTAAPAQAADSVKITQPWARATVLSSRPAAAYVTLESAQGDRLVAADTPVADRVMIHAITTDNKDVKRMTPLDGLDLPAGKPVMLAPGGTHLMLMGLSDKLSEGTQIPVTLSFQSAGKLRVMFPVLGLASDGPAEDGK